MSNRIGANGAGIRLVDIQGRPISANRIGANGAGIRKPSNSVSICPTCGAPVLGANGAGIRIPSDSLTPRRLVGTNGAGILRL